MTGTWKRDFASGLVVFVPVLVSGYVIAYFYGMLAGTPLASVITPTVLSELHLPSHDAFVTFVQVTGTMVGFVVLATVLGYFTRTAVGGLLEGRLDDAMNQIPGLRVVYNASKMAVETAITESREVQTPVRLEAWDDIDLTAFKTGKSTGDGYEILFLPTAPNITSGFVVEVRPEDYTVLDESIEEALGRIISGGFGDADSGDQSVGLWQRDPGSRSTADADEEDPAPAARPRADDGRSGRESTHGEE